MIVLKQSARLSTRWQHDLLHELWHAGQAAEEPDVAIVEAGGPAGAELDTAEEAAANRFAGDVMLAGRAEELAKLCVSEAGHRLQALKSVVPRVAAGQGVSTGALANYLAFRLSVQGENWWGAAANLQSTGTDPWRVARDALLQRADLSNLNEVDRVLLTQAMREQEGHHVGDGLAG